MNGYRLLIATDGSDSARDAAEAATRLPLPPVTAVDVLFVCEPRRVFAYGRSERAAVLDMLNEVDQRTAEEACSSIMELVRRRWPDAAVEALRRTGFPAEEIVRCAEERGSRLIVLGSHGRSRLRRFVLGSVSDAVSMLAPTSVFVGRNAEMVGLAHESVPGVETQARGGLRLVFAHDGSETCEAVLAELLAARWPAGTAVTVLAVLTVVAAFHMEIVQHASPAWEEEKRAARETVEHAVQRLQDVGVAARGEVREAENAALAIIHCAQETDADVVVLGRRAHRRLLARQPVFGGAVAKHVIENATSSVWSVLPQSERTRVVGTDAQ
ncbi:MAG: hypothetical protein D6725_12110 [Planctomycetota bacterium]|nr:MAG: hypothetical protein D6725_12110 [Planctomycetota bacterium]